MCDSCQEGKKKKVMCLKNCWVHFCYKTVVVLHKLSKLNKYFCIDFLKTHLISATQQNLKTAVVVYHALHSGIKFYIWVVYFWTRFTAVKLKIKVLCIYSRSKRIPFHAYRWVCKSNLCWISEDLLWRLVNVTWLALMVV